MTTPKAISTLVRGQLFSFVDSEADTDLLTVVDLSIAYDAETKRRMPGVAVLATLPTGVDMAYYLQKNFQVYLPGDLEV